VFEYCVGLFLLYLVIGIIHAQQYDFESHRVLLKMVISAKS